MRFNPLVYLFSFNIDHISGTWPLGDLFNPGIFDRRAHCLLSTSPLGQGQKRPAGGHSKLFPLEIEIVWNSTYLNGIDGNGYDPI